MSEPHTDPTRILAVETRPEVHAFVRAVRARLSDLTEEEREELAGGLEADMSDLVVERGVEALPDPADYAAELRMAAGFSAQAQAARGVVRDRLTAWLDRGSGTWNRWVDAEDHLGLPAFAHTLRPVWWVLRALCATALLTEIFSNQGIFGFTLTRAVVALVAVVLSVQLGRGSWGIGAWIRRSLLLRILLIGLNVFAVILLPVMFDRFFAARGDIAYAEQAFFPGDTLSFRGMAVQNVYPYDAQGKPLVGVQLVDQDGRRLVVARNAVDEQTHREISMVPWMNGRTELFSVFPLSQREIDPETGLETGAAAIQPPPFSSVPPVTMPGPSPSASPNPSPSPSVPGNGG